MRNLVLHKSFLSCWKAFLNAGLGEQEDPRAVRFAQCLGGAPRAGKGHVPVQQLPATETIVSVGYKSLDSGMLYAGPRLPPFRTEA